MFRPRIRTVKPETSKHLDLFDLEKETGLPIRFSYVMLWCHCDRAGRFTWEPRRLKSEILPYDDIDFSRVLDALVTRGFLVRYASNGREFGWCPGLERNQVFNPREMASELPEIPEDVKKQYLDASMTREPRVADALPTRDSRNGTEWNGMERKRSTPPTPSKSRGAMSVATVISDEWKTKPWGSPERFMVKFNSEGPEEWPAVEGLSNGRLKKIGEYLKQFPAEEFWTEVFKQAKSSKFCREYRNGGLDWLLQRGKNDQIENCVKVYEGKYA